MPAIQNSDFFGTPFTSRMAPLNLNQRWVAWDKCHIADTYAGFAVEYRAIRNTAALIDMSPLGKYEISGPGTEVSVPFDVGAETGDVPARIAGLPFVTMRRSG